MKRSVTTLSLALALVATLVPAPDAKLVAQTLPHVRVAAIPIDVGALSYFANQQGFFKKHGLDVEIIQGGNGAAIAAAVVGGSIDIGDGNTTTLATGHERGVPFVMAAPSGAYSSKAPTGALLVAKNSPIRTPKDLVGKTIGVSGVRNISEVASRAWLEKNGVSGDSVKFVEITFSQMGPALTAGRIDAAMAEEPSFSTIIGGDVGRVLATPYDNIAPQWIEGGYFVTLEYAKANPDVIRKFADAMAEAAVWANANHAATAAMLAEFAKTPVAPNQQRMYYPPRLRAADLQPLIDASAKYGVLKAPFPAKDMFAPGLATE
jgi:NitT/TauT family transport system substrate-binding protein